MNTDQRAARDEHKREDKLVNRQEAIIGLMRAIQQANLTLIMKHDEMRELILAPYKHDEHQERMDVWTRSSIITKIDMIVTGLAKETGIHPLSIQTMITTSDWRDMEEHVLSIPNWQYEIHKSVAEEQCSDCVQLIDAFETLQYEHQQALTEVQALRNHVETIQETQLIAEQTREDPRSQSASASASTSLSPPPSPPSMCQEIHDRMFTINPFETELNCEQTRSNLKFHNTFWEKYGSWMKNKKAKTKAQKNTQRKTFIHEMMKEDSQGLRQYLQSQVWYDTINEKFNEGAQQFIDMTRECVKLDNT